MRRKSLWAALLLSAGALRAAEVVGVLSADTPLYREALQEFQQAFGASAPVVSLEGAPPAWPQDMKVAVAFGSRAAVYPLPAGVARVVCLTPSLSHPVPAPAARVQMLPLPQVLAERLKKDVQPQLQRIAVFWVSADFDAYVAALEKSFKSLGVVLEPYRLAKGDDLSVRLGALARPQAIWVPPDGAMINSVNISTLLQYASINRVSFYSPNAQFVEMGALASAAPSREDLARLAAAAARDFLAGRTPPALSYASRADLFLNQAALEHLGLPLTPELRKKAKTVY